MMSCKLFFASESHSTGAPLLVAGHSAAAMDDWRGLALAVAASAATLTAYSLMRRLGRTYEELEAEREERMAERAARIKAQREVDALAARAEALRGTSGSAAAASSESGATGGCFRYSAIGVAVSPFPKRRGCPRQGALCPAVRTLLVMRPGLASEAFSGLEEFSHAWILFHFDENTTSLKHSAAAVTASSSAAAHLVGVPLRVHPPGLGGAARGLFATRTPHRPNAVGLTLVRLGRVSAVKAPWPPAWWVEGGSSSSSSGGASSASSAAADARSGCVAVEVWGCDLVDGTAVLDIKPYLGTGLDAPIESSDESVRIPTWIEDNRSESARIDVRFADAVLERLPPAPIASGLAPLHSSQAAWVDAARQILSLDPRSVHRGRGKSSMVRSLASAEDAAWEIEFDGAVLRVRFEADSHDATVATVFDVQPLGLAELPRRLTLRV